MAQAFSPWRDASAPVAAAFAGEAYYPPFFPLCLALAGAAYDFGRAHVLDALLVAAWIPLAYALGARWLGDRVAAAATAVALACLPSLWVNARGILSEPLFGVLLLVALLLVERRGGSRIRDAAIAIALSALALTRSVGLVAALAYAAWAMATAPGAWGARLRRAAPALLPFLAYGAWVVLRPAATADDYARIGAESLAELLRSGHGWSILAARMSHDVQAMGQSWIGAFMLFWVEERPLPWILAGVLGLAALAGLALRLRQGRADGWILAAYLATFLVWPFPGQMARFLFPVLPALLLYAFVAVIALARRFRAAPALPALVATAVILSLCVPALAFIRERARLGAQGGYAQISDWYTTADLERARRRSEVHLGLAADMAEIATRTRPGDRVMWVVPGYVALLANRYGVRAPSPGLVEAAYRDAVLRASPDYVFLSRYHPRDTVSGAAWDRAAAALAGWAIVYARSQDRSDGLDSVLLRVPR
jgi:hypothetical protein